MSKSRMIFRVLVAGTAILGATLTATAAEAAPAPASFLHLSVTNDFNGNTRVAELTCDPDGGTHPHPVVACNELRAVDGNISALPENNRPCPLIYAPVTARADGFWRGREIRFTENYPNQCVLERHTGAVFAFADAPGF